MADFLPLPDQLGVPLPLQRQFLESLQLDVGPLPNEPAFRLCFIFQAVHFVRSHTPWTMSDLTLSAYPLHTWFRRVYERSIMYYRFPADQATAGYDEHILKPFVVNLTHWTTLLMQTPETAMAAPVGATTTPPPQPAQHPPRRRTPTSGPPVQPPTPPRDLPPRQPRPQAPPPPPASTPARPAEARNNPIEKSREVRCKGMLASLGIDPKSDHAPETLQGVVAAFNFSSQLLAAAAQIRKIPDWDVIIIKFDSIPTAEKFMRGKAAKLASLPSVSVNYQRRYASTAAARLSQVHKRFEQFKAQHMPATAAPPAPTEDGPPQGNELVPLPQREGGPPEPMETDRELLGKRGAQSPPKAARPLRRRTPTTEDSTEGVEESKAAST